LICLVSQKCAFRILLVPLRGGNVRRGEGQEGGVRGRREQHRGQLARVCRGVPHPLRLLLPRGTKEMCALCTPACILRALGRPRAGDSHNPSNLLVLHSRVLPPWVRGVKYFPFPPFPLKAGIFVLKNLASWTYIAPPLLSGLRAGRGADRALAGHGGVYDRDPARPGRGGQGGGRHLRRR
jgi:hypothetical protein